MEKGSVREVVLKACAKGPRFALAYDNPGAARTSNAVDRLMSYQDRLLYARGYFHGTRESARLSVRAMALLWNFHPYGARLRRADQKRCSPCADVNGFQYHDNWLHNLLIASSLGGRRASTQSGRLRIDPGPADSDPKCAPRERTKGHTPVG